MTDLEDDDPESLPPEDLTDEELGVGRPPDPYAVEVGRRRLRRAREQWQYLPDEPLPDGVVVGPTTLGTVVRALRWKARMNQRELALAAEVPRSSIDRIESAGDSDVRLSTLVRLVGACGLRLAVVDDEGTQLAVPFEQTSFHDRADRLLPAHLQTFDPHRSRWWGDGRYQRRGEQIRTPARASRGRVKARPARLRPTADGAR